MGPNDPSANDTQAITIERRRRGDLVERSKKATVDD